MTLVLLLFKQFGNARLGWGELHPISPKTPAPKYQPNEKNKTKGNSRKQKTLWNSYQYYMGNIGKSYEPSHCFVFDQTVYFIYFVN